MAQGDIANRDFFARNVTRRASLVAINDYLSTINSPVVQSESLGRLGGGMDRHLRAAIHLAKAFRNGRDRRHTTAFSFFDVVKG